ncbi:hypothetical protein ACFO3J_15585 [Streptomyces polygonati]|uniref:Uncharacterized protein n=1 Tax=Streptomyces polygonati TaxID=1617087 RepID=A0ABV8HMT6_9ACTN
MPNFAGKCPPSGRERTAFASEPVQQLLNEGQSARIADALRTLAGTLLGGGAARGE